MLDDHSQPAGLADLDDLLGAGELPGRCVGVVGGSGGAGASTLAVALAVTAAASSRVALLDLDPLGGGLDLLLGLEDAAGLRWPALASATGRLSSSALTAALPSVSGARVLSWDCGDVLDVPPDAVGAVVEAAVRGVDLVVLDLPRGDALVGPAVAACDLLLVVTPAAVRAVAATARILQRTAGRAADVRVVVRGPAPSGLTGPEVAAFLGVPLVGWLRPEPRLHRYQERGLLPRLSGRSPLGGLCTAVLRELFGGTLPAVRPVAA